jgi:hypothetical protein
MAVVAVLVTSLIYFSEETNKMPVGKCENTCLCFKQMSANVFPAKTPYKGSSDVIRGN